MIAWLARPPVLRIVRIVVGVVFLVAAIAKLADPAAFARQIHNYRLAPVATENVLAMMLPGIELVAALALITGRRARAGAIVALALMIGFTVLVGAAWARGLDIECGCFGTLDASRVGASKFFQNLGLVALSAAAAVRARAGATTAG